MWEVSHVYVTEPQEDPWTWRLSVILPKSRHTLFLEKGRLSVRPHCSGHLEAHTGLRADFTL